MHQVAYSIFGYARGELDGKNVSILMPQPFSSKHDGFLHNYLSTGQAKILNSNRDVVALKKVRGHVCCQLDLPARAPFPELCRRRQTTSSRVNTPVLAAPVLHKN